MALAEVVAAAPDAPHRILSGDPVRVAVSGSFKGDLPQEHCAEENSGDSEQFRRLDAAAEVVNTGYNIPVLSSYGGGMGCDTRQVFSGMVTDNGQSMYYTPSYEFPQQSGYTSQPQGPYMSGATGYCGPQYGTYYQQMSPGLVQYYPSEQEVNKAGVKKLNSKDVAQSTRAKPGAPEKTAYQVAPKSVLPDSSSQWGLYPAAAPDGAYYGSSVGYDCYMPQQWHSSARGFQPIPPPQNIGALGNCNPPIPGGGPGRFQNFPRVHSSPNISGRAMKGNSVKSGLASGGNWRAKDVSKTQGKGDGSLSGVTPAACTDLMQKGLPGKPKMPPVQDSDIILHQPPLIAEQQCSSVNRSDYNREDFQVSYERAKFFIIKSYSEDDVHKSIKYSVWSSTPNGNKRLDEAYRKAQEKPESPSTACPVFLFFSVNCSGQFCGVAEMVGPVDFGKNMDFWLQGKWNGCMYVKWHVIKDVPNGHFRHIILSNNENKPVTHSRDTQEVHFHEGLEMLKIFKFFPMRTSLLDDFAFYDGRQRVLQERKLRQQLRQQVIKQIKERVSEKASSIGDGSLESAKDSSRPFKLIERTSNEATATSNQVKENGGCIEVGTVKHKVDAVKHKLAREEASSNMDGSLESGKEIARPFEVTERTTNGAAALPDQVKENGGCVQVDTVKCKVDIVKQKLANLKVDSKADSSQVLKTKDENAQENVSVMGLDKSKSKVTDDVCALKDLGIKAKALEGSSEAADLKKPKFNGEASIAGKDPSIKAKTMEGLSGTADKSKPKSPKAEVMTTAGKEDTARLVINYKKALLEGIQGKVIVLDQSIGA